MADFDSAPDLVGALVGASHTPLLLFNGQSQVVRASRSFCAAFDIDPLGIEGLGLDELGEGEWGQPQLHQLLDSALAGGPDQGDSEMDLVRPGASNRNLTVSVEALARGDQARVLMVINDLTQIRRVENLNVSLLLEKDALLQERAVLLQEMQHRIANSLQIIASVLLLKARAVKSEETRLSLKDAHDRVMSVAAVQQHLQSTTGQIDLGPYLTKLCASLASSMIRESRPLTLQVRADDATVGSHEAVSLGLIVTELVINALKHAFPGRRGGSIVVDYRVASPGWTLSVTDDGVGRPMASPEARVGLGTSVVEALARQLGARVELSDARPGARITVINEGAPSIR